MATPFANEKTCPLIHNSSGKEDNSSVKDAGSLGDICTVSDSQMIRYKKKQSKKSMKDHSTRLKIPQNTFSTRYTTNKGDNVRRIKSVSSHITLPPPSIINENTRKNNRMTKEPTSLKKSVKLTKRKTVNQKASNPVSKEIKKSEVSDLNKGSSFFDNVFNSSEETQTKFDSLIDFGKNAKTDVAFPQASFARNALSVTSYGTLNSNNRNSKHRKHNFDYMKEFDLIRYGGASEEHMTLNENQNIFSLFPKISSSAPVTLPRRKYDHVTLSVGGSTAVSSESKEDQKDSNETTMRIEFEKAGVCGSSEESEIRQNLTDSSRPVDTCFVNDKIYVLNVKKPVRIKCIDEVTHKMKDIIIYSDEFLKGILTEKGILTKTEVYEYIRNESTDYQGKNLRTIIDVEKHCCNLNTCRKSQGDIRSGTAKMSKQISAKVSKHTTQTNKKKHSRIHFCNKSSATHNYTDQRKKETNTEQKIPLPTNISNETDGIESVDTDFTQADEDSALVKNKSSKDIQILKGENKKFKSKNDKKSRTALKRINIESIIASSFSYYFHFYAKLGHRVKCGAAISKMNSTKWLKKSGIVNDKASKSIAENCFRTVASAKYVLNISDYIKCLNKIARDRRMLLVEMLHEMMNADLHSELMFKMRQESNQRTEPTAQDSPAETKSTETTKSKKDAKKSSTVL